MVHLISKIVLKINVKICSVEDFNKTIINEYNQHVIYIDLKEWNCFLTPDKRCWLQM